MERHVLRDRTHLVRAEKEGDDTGVFRRGKIRVLLKSPVFANNV